MVQHLLPWSPGKNGRDYAWTLNSDSVETWSSTLFVFYRLWLGGKGDVSKTWKQGVCVCVTRRGASESPGPRAPSWGRNFPWSQGFEADVGGWDLEIAQLHAQLSLTSVQQKQTLNLSTEGLWTFLLVSLSCNSGRIPSFISGHQPDIPSPGKAC